jgi:peptidyl-prolyl cis-trans isomerase SurA
MILTVLTGTGVAGAASSIKVIVNKEPVTSYDIQLRAAFLKLRRVKGNHTSMATDELIDETLKMQEAKRINMVVSSSEVDAAFARFASGNKMSTAQLSSILNRAGVTSQGFRKYIRAQMSWQRALGARYRAENRPGQNESFTAQLQKGGNSSTSTQEYTLQQIIFVVPQSQRKSQLARRRIEAKNFRNRFRDCDSTISFAKGLRDVTVRSLGRVLNPQLPPEWKKAVENTPEGKATQIQDTDKGVEFLAVCRLQTVKDDSLGDLDFGKDGLEAKVSELEKKYLAELKERAKIIRR